jgi:RNA polymerase sigma-70 factor (ECF subfamily)
MDATASAFEFEQIVDEYQAKLNGYARRLTRNREDAEEVVQDALLRAYRALNRMSQEQLRSLRLKGWLYTITLNAARNFLRKKTPMCVSLDSSEDAQRMLSQHAERETPEAALEELASLEEIEATLQRLPEHLRPAARLRFVDDRTHSEIARAFDQPIGTVKSHLHRALIFMRRAYAEAA